MSIVQLTERLLARSGRGAKYGLERVVAALAAAGQPERDLKLVHVAGTNGKGSVCAMVEAMMRAAGLRTGMFTSPHLSHINERIQLDGSPIDDERFASALKVALDVEPEVTFFEAMTIAGFVAMRDANVDCGVLEVGLGGRLDATNVITRPLCAVITSIGFDHTRLLGETLPEIAREKAGIIKADAPVVVGPMPDEARAAIVSVAAARGASAIVHVYDGDGGDLGEIGLTGLHQRNNAATAVAAVRQLGDQLTISEAAISNGIRQVRWPGRLERFERHGVTILLDCAHNIHATRALRDALSGQDASKTHLVFGALGDKQWREMLELLGPLAARRHYCTPLAELAGRQPASPEALAEALPGAAHDSKVAAFEAAMASATRGDTVLVTGSVFLVGAIRAHLEGEDADVPVPL